MRVKIITPDRVARSSGPSINDAIQAAVDTGITVTNISGEAPNPPSSHIQAKDLYALVRRILSSKEGEAS